MGRIERDKLTVTKGAEPLLVEGDPDSTYEVRCSECLSILYWTSRDGYYGVPYGTLADEPTLKPMHHQFVGSLCGTRSSTTFLSTTRGLPPITNGDPPPDYWVAAIRDLPEMG